MHEDTNDLAAIEVTRERIIKLYGQLTSEGVEQVDLLIGAHGAFEGLLLVVVGRTHAADWLRRQADDLARRIEERG